MTPRTLLAITFAAALAVPTAAGFGWSSRGGWEPSTPEDLSMGRMYSIPDRDDNIQVKKVYFNGIAAQYPANLYANLGAAESKLLAPNLMYGVAYLGIWKDCNKDGYIGMADTAQTVYEVALADTSVCGVGSPHRQIANVTYNARVGAVGEREVIRELLPIAPSTSLVTGTVKDDAVQVWGDLHRPGDDRVHFDCPHSPFPYGTSGSTGGFLMWADCFTDFTVTKQINTLVRTAGQDDLAFEDPYHPERECDSALQQTIPIWGNPQAEQFCNDPNTGILEREDDNQYGHVWDCDADNDKLFDVRDPTAEDGEKGDLSQVSDPTGGELSGDFTGEGVTIFDAGGDRNITDDDGTYSGGGVVFGDTLERPNPSPSTGSPGSSMYTFIDSIDQGGLRGCDGGATLTSILGDRMFGEESHFAATNPADGKRLVDLPMAFANPSATNTDTRWTSAVFYLSPTYNGGTVRKNLEPEGAVYFSWYARVGANTTAAGASLPAGDLTNTGVYAAEACPRGFTGRQGEWDCNPDNWWRKDLGGYGWEEFGGFGAPVVPGVSYHLRDTDCYDGTVAHSGVYLGHVAAYTEGGCPVPAN